MTAGPRPGRTGKPRRAGLLVVAVLALAGVTAGCSSSSDDGVATADSGSGASLGTNPATGSSGSVAGSGTSSVAGSGTSSTSIGGGTATSGPTSTAPSGSTGSGSVAGAGALAVGPDGLQLISGAHITQLPFGTSGDEVATALEAVLGVSPTITEASPECGNQASEQLLWPGLLSIDVRDDEMISWHLDRTSPLTTVSGVGLGVARSEVESSIVISVEETSLGTEFHAVGDSGGGLGGLLSGPGATATVTELWGGEICAFR